MLMVRRCFCFRNVAVTVVAAVRGTVQAPVREQRPPLQPAKREPAAGVAARETAVPVGKLAEQVAPQLMPAGLEVTEPEPEPDFVTESVAGERAKVAVTVVAAVRGTVQAPGPEQPPLQPAKREPAAGVAARETAVPVGKLAEQVAPQLMPAGLEVTEPEPEPD